MPAKVPAQRRRPIFTIAESQRLILAIKKSDLYSSLATAARPAWSLPIAALHAYARQS